MIITQHLRLVFTKINHGFGCDVIESEMYEFEEIGVHIARGWYVVITLGFNETLLLGSKPKCEINGLED